MKFIECSKPADTDLGVNSPVNMDLVLSYSPGEARPSSGDICRVAPAIIFTALYAGVGNTWTFESVADRDAEIARIDSIVIALTDAAILREVSA